VLATLRGEQAIPAGLILPDELRWERPSQQLE
jgi:hypothetical protein